MKNILKLFIFSSLLFIFSTLSALAASSFAPKLVGAYDIKGDSAEEIFVDGNYAYIADYSDTLQIVDMTNPVSPELVGSYKVPEVTDGSGDVMDVVVSGQYAYIGAGIDGLIILDVSNPAKPKFVSQYKEPFVYVNRIVVSGNYAYSTSVYARPAGTYIFDISNPKAPMLVSKMDFASTPVDIVAQGDYAYIADTNSSKLHIVDVSNHLSPKLISSIKTRGSVQRISVQGKYAYISNSWAGLTIIDVSNPKSPVIRDIASTIDNQSMGAFNFGDYTCVVEGTLKKMRIFNTSNPSSISVASEVAIKAHILNDVVVSGNYAYIAAGNAGMLIVQIKSQTEYKKDINANTQFAEALKGKILLQTESKGEAWYVNPKDGRKYALGKPSDAAVVIKKLGIGISNENLAKIPRNGIKDKGDQAMMNRLKGRILIQTQGKGEAWYVHPTTGKRYSLGKPADALAVIKKLGVGITNANLNKVSSGLIVR